MGLAQANLRYAYTRHDEADDGLAAANRALCARPDHRRGSSAAGLASRDARPRTMRREAEIEMALRLNPDSWEVNKEAARVYLPPGQARGGHASSRDEQPSSPKPTSTAAECCRALYLARGDVEARRECAAKMIDHVEGALARDPDNGAALAYGALSFAALGNSSARANGSTARCCSIPRICTCDTIWRGRCSHSSMTRNEALELLGPALGESRQDADQPGGGRSQPRSVARRPSISDNARVARRARLRRQRRRSSPTAAAAARRRS